MTPLIEKTLQSIADKKIQPIPLWKKRLKNSMYWVVSIFLILLASVATAISLHVVFEIDWQAYRTAQFSLSQMFISGVPIITIFLFGLFLFGGVIILQKTKRGYRYPLVILCGLFFSLSVLLGYGIEKSPIDKPAEQFLLRNIPHAEKLSATLLPTSTEQWSQPEKGLLGGTVVSVTSQKSIQMKDKSDKTWTVEYEESSLDEETKVYVDEDIKVIGRKKDSDTFEAKEIQNWEESHRDKGDREIKDEEDESHEYEDASSREEERD